MTGMGDSRVSGDREDPVLRRNNVINTSVTQMLARFAERPWHQDEQ